MSLALVGALVGATRRPEVGGGGGDDALTGITSATPQTETATNLHYGWQFTPIEAVTVVGVRVYAGHSGTETVRIFQGNVEIIEQNVTAVEDAWAEAMLDTPVALTEDVLHVIGMREVSGASRNIWFLNTSTDEYASQITPGFSQWTSGAGDPSSGTANRAMVDFLFTVD